MDKMDYKDKQKRLQAAEYTNKNLKVKEIDFIIGDTVLLKWDRPTKHTPLFDWDPYTIKEIKGTMITAHRHNHQVTRNSKFFKKIPKTTAIGQASVPKKTVTFRLPTEQQPQSMPAVPETPPLTQPRTSRHQPDPQPLQILMEEQENNITSAPTLNNPFNVLRDETIQIQKQSLRPRNPNINYDTSKRHVNKRKQNKQ
jgi:hypothetical protein